MLEDEFETKEWQIEIYKEIADTFIKKGLREENIWSNGYQYKFEYNNQNIDFCVQEIGYNGVVRFVGNVYNKGIESKNPRDICIYGDDSQTLIRRLIQTIEKS
jgi:hypothetical protein